MGYVTLDHTIAFAKTIVKTADNIDMNVYREWVYYGALLDLGISDDEIDVCQIIPKNFLAPLPENCRHIIELSLFDSSGNQLSHKFRTGKRRIYSDSRLTSTAVVGSNIDSCVPVDVSNDVFNLVLGTNGSNVASILLRYFKYPLDAAGQPLIREEDMLAIAYFIKFMTAIRDNRSRSEIDQYQRLWALHADKCKAAKKMNSMSIAKAKTVLSEMMRMLPQFDQNLF